MIVIEDIEKKIIDWNLIGIKVFKLFKGIMIIVFI